MVLIKILFFCIFLDGIWCLINLIVNLVMRLTRRKKLNKNIEGYHAALEYNKALHKVLKEQEKELKDQINFIGHIDSTLNELGIPKQSENEEI